MLAAARMLQNTSIGLLRVGLSATEHRGNVSPMDTSAGGQHAAAWP